VFNSFYKLVERTKPLISHPERSRYRCEAEERLDDAYPRQWDVFCFVKEYLIKHGTMFVSDSHQIALRQLTVFFFELEELEEKLLSVSPILGTLRFALGEVEGTDNKVLLDRDVLRAGVTVFMAMQLLGLLRFMCAGPDGSSSEPREDIIDIVAKSVGGYPSFTRCKEVRGCHLQR